MRILTIAIAVTLVSTAAAAADKRPLPYYASIGAAKARMRTGPAPTYPASWLYQRADLPVRVVAVFKDWRQVEDPDGTKGWMQGKLIGTIRTAVVRPGEPAAMRERPAEAAKLMWRVAPGVVGRLSQCGGGWCRFDVKGQAGYVEVVRLWGVETGESVP